MLCLALAVSVLSARAGHAQTPQTPADSVTDRQGVDAFNSITDGQPNPPRRPELSLTVGWQQGLPAQVQLGFEITPGGSRWLRNALFAAFVETINAGEGANDAEPSVSLQWQQRWRTAGGGWPTIATSATLQLPMEGPHETDVVLTGIVAADAGVGVAYLNVYSETMRGMTPGGQRGILLGYKLPLIDGLSAYGDALVQRQAGQSSLTPELSAELDLASGLTIGPGVSVGLARGSSPVWGGGIFITYTF